MLMLGPLCVSTYTTPRDLFIGLSSVGLLFSDALWGASFSLSGEVVGLLGAIMVWWLLCAVNSPRPKQALTNTIPLIATLIVCMHLKYSLYGLMILVSSGLLSAVFGILQTRKLDPFGEPSLPTQCIGSHGNTLQHGGFLLICFFLSLLLVSYHSPWWFVSSLVLLVTIWLTKARGVFLGTLVGGVVLAIGLGSTLLWGLIALGLVVGSIAIRAYRPELFKVNTAKERRNYWKVAMRQALKKPIFGLGADMFGVAVPFVQRQLNEESNGRFLMSHNYEAPWPTRAHSDMLQWIVDWGFVGLILMLAPIIGAIVLAPNMYVTAAIVGFIVAGGTMHFHTLRSTNGMYWGLIVLSMGSVMGSSFSVPGGTLWVGIVMLLLVLQYSLSEFCFDIAYHSYLKHLRMKAPPGQPLSFKSSSCSARMQACLFWARQGRSWEVLKHASYILHNFDGTQRIWEVWNILGVAFMMSKHLNHAEACFKEALTFLPSYTPCRQNLENLSHIKDGYLHTVQHRD